MSPVGGSCALQATCVLCTGLLLVRYGHTQAWALTPYSSSSCPYISLSDTPWQCCGMLPVFQCSTACDMSMVCTVVVP